LTFVSSALSVSEGKGGGRR